MPGCGVHLVIAARVLGPGPAGAATRAAFLAGAVAPDMGYFPGGDRFVSDLAHYVRSAGLARCLVRAAGGPVAAAFARGWATHVLADGLIHPLINRAAGELTGRPGPRTFADDPAAHVRVEQGLDAVVGARLGATWRVAGRPPAGPVVGPLGEAFARTYGFRPARSALAASVRAADRAVPVLLGYGRAVARRFAGGRGGPAGAATDLLFAAARVATAAVPRSPAAAFARPARPADRLVDEVIRVIDGFPDRFAAAEARGFADLADLNLDTGEPETAPYAPSSDTLDRLHRAGGG
jgi:hypothetical protein